MLCQLKQFYQQQLITRGVSYQKAEAAAQKLTLRDFHLIAEIWVDWADILTQIETEKLPTLRREERDLVSK